MGPATEHAGRRLFVIVDSAFLFANAAKIVDGGYVPLALATIFTA